MSDDFYTFVDSGDPAPDNAHLNGVVEIPVDTPATSENGEQEPKRASFAARIAVYDDMLSTPRVIVIEPQDVRTYLEETTNTVYRCMKEQGGKLSLMVIREIVENFIHAHFAEPIISILDGGNTIRFADQGPGIEDKERAFDFGVTSANRDMKRYIRGTGAGFPMVQEYLENAGGAVSIEDNMGSGTVVTVSLDPKRVAEIERAGGRGAAVRPENEMGYNAVQMIPGTQNQMQNPWQMQQGMPMQQPTQQAAQLQQQTMPMQQTMLPQQQEPQMGTQPGVDPATRQQAVMYAGYQPATQPRQYQQASQAYMPPYGQQQAYVSQGYQPWPISYQQPMAQTYAGYQQPAAQMVYPNQAMQFQQPPQPDVYISERGQQVLQHLMMTGECGPTDLARAYGSSAPTWSRDLRQLAEAGLVIKNGQKFHLTEMGKAHMSQPVTGQQTMGARPMNQPQNPQ